MRAKNCWDKIYDEIMSVENNSIIFVNITVYASCVTEKSGEWAHQKLYSKHVFFYLEKNTCLEADSRNVMQYLLLLG
ncbi:hypothetical protein [Bartonella pachyuromydis]|uniref:Uncharacterized protein n=1 Tax=Bartonella pachyuromydis TaxID=931097 RepID=A0ABP8VFD4_9HYPH